MARSSYVYIVMGPSPDLMSDDVPVAAFTVKHEMITWLKKCQIDGPGVLRLRDGRTCTPVDMDLSELLDD